MGMKRGDIILSINNMDVQTEEGIAEALRKAPNYVWVKILNVNGQRKYMNTNVFPKVLINWVLLSFQGRTK